MGGEAVEITQGAGDVETKEELRVAARVGIGVIGSMFERRAAAGAERLK